MDEKKVDWEQLCRDYVEVNSAFRLAAAYLETARARALDSIWLDMDINELVDQAERAELDARLRWRRAYRRMVKAVNSESDRR